MYLASYTYKEAARFFEGVIRTNSINGAKLSMLFLQFAGCDRGSIPIPAGAAVHEMVVDPRRSGGALTSEQAAEIWEFIDRAEELHHMIAIVGDGDGTIPASVAAGIYLANLRTPIEDTHMILRELTAAADYSVDVRIAQLMQDVRTLVFCGLWPLDAITEDWALTEQDVVEGLLTTPDVRWRIYCPPQWNQNSPFPLEEFMYIIRTFAPNTVDVSESPSHYGHRCPAAAFGRLIHAVLVPQLCYT